MKRINIRYYKVYNYNLHVVFVILKNVIIFRVWLSSSGPNMFKSVPIKIYCVHSCIMFSTVNAMWNVSRIG